MIAVWIGVTISPTTMPATNVDPVKTLGDDSGLVGSVSGTARNGTHPNQVASQRDTPIACSWNRNTPHSPNTTLGTAAIRSTPEVRIRLSRTGAISEMNSDVPSASGSETTTATSAMNTPLVSTEAMPNSPVSGDQASVVRNANPRCDRASAARNARKAPTPPMIARTTRPDARATPR